VLPEAGQTRAQEENTWVLAAEREIRSDYLLMKVPGRIGWQPFRDVFEVDGRKTRERDVRLEKLFLDGPPTATLRAAAITAEGARHDIGFVQQNMNLPTLALLFLKPVNRSRFAFWKAGEAVMGGVHAWEIAYLERRAPTMVQTDAGSVPVDGSFRIGPVTGRVVRSLVGLTLEGTAMEIAVTYRPDESTGRLWVPAEMSEVYEDANRKLECAVTYSSLRRLVVPLGGQVPEAR
jgi:hypothetical protein